MNKIIIGSLVVMVIAVGGIFMLLRGNDTATTPISNGQANIATVNGKQVIQINAKGGYAPRNTLAKANMPTVINVTTNGTYDCSSSLSIPSIGFRKALPASGTTPIEIPPQQPGATIKGVCAMGMYNFAVNFN